MSDLKTRPTEASVEAFIEAAEVYLDRRLALDQPEGEYHE